MREIIDVNGIVAADGNSVNKPVKAFVNVGDILVKVNGKLLEDTTLVEVTSSSS